MDDRDYLQRSDGGRLKGLAAMDIGFTAGCSESFVIAPAIRERLLAVAIAPALRERLLAPVSAIAPFDLLSAIDNSTDLVATSSVDVLLDAAMKGTSVLRSNGRGYDEQRSAPLS